MLIIVIMMIVMMMVVMMVMLMSTCNNVFDVGPFGEGGLFVDGVVVEGKFD